MTWIYSHLQLLSIESAALPLKQKLGITQQAPDGLPVASKLTIFLRKNKFSQEQAIPKSADTDPGHRQMLMTSRRQKGQTQKLSKFPDLDETSLIMDENCITINTSK